MKTNKPYQKGYCWDEDERKGCCCNKDKRTFAAGIQTNEPCQKDRLLGRRRTKLTRKVAAGTTTLRPRVEQDVRDATEEEAEGKGERNIKIFIRRKEQLRV